MNLHGVCHISNVKSHIGKKSNWAGEIRHCDNLSLGFNASLGSWTPRGINLGFTDCKGQGSPGRTEILCSWGEKDYIYIFSTLSESFLSLCLICSQSIPEFIPVVLHPHIPSVSGLLWPKCFTILLILTFIGKSCNFVWFQSTTGNLKCLQVHDWRRIQQTDVRKENQLCFSTAGFTAKPCRGGKTTGVETHMKILTAFCSHIPGWLKTSRAGLHN